MTEENNIVEQAIEEKPHLAKYIRDAASESGRLSSFIDRIERLEEEKRDIQADISEIYREAKGAGFSAKGIREIIKLRRLDPATRAEEEYMRDEYKKMVGISD
jgi:uncharacterized protein (UPF0335 family)